MMPVACQQSPCSHRAVTVQSPCSHGSSKHPHVPTLSVVSPCARVYTPRRKVHAVFADVCGPSGSSLGLTRYTIEDMNELVNLLADYIGLTFDSVEIPTGRRISRPAAEPRVLCSLSPPMCCPSATAVPFMQREREREQLQGESSNMFGFRESAMNSLGKPAAWQLRNHPSPHPKSRLFAKSQKRCGQAVGSSRLTTLIAACYNRSFESHSVLAY